MKIFWILFCITLSLTSCNWKSDDAGRGDHLLEGDGQKNVHSLVDTNQGDNPRGEGNELAARMNTKNLIEDFIPKGWKMIVQESGDLNKDGIDDHVIVIENTDDKNFKAQCNLSESYRIRYASC